jgi:exodeoxyribonuclease VII large subunit
VAAVGLVQLVQRSSQRLAYAQRALATPRAPLASLEARVSALRARAQGAAHHEIADRRLTLGRQREMLLRQRPTAGRGVPGERLARLSAPLAQRRQDASIRLAALRGRVEALDPRAVLRRGYAMALSGDGRVVTDAAALRLGDALTLRLARGGAEVQVRALLPGEAEEGGRA